MTLFIDLQTSGLPNYKGLKFGETPSFEKTSLYENARILKINLILCDKEYNEIKSLNKIIFVKNIDITNSDIHGITNEIMKNKGILLVDLALEILEFIQETSIIYVHNAKFDINVLKSELFRLNLKNIRNEINRKEIYSTMENTKNLVKAKNINGCIKYPKLTELYYFLFKENMENTNNSLNLLKIVKELKKINYII
jgi:DNA polymerase III epsilon subunit-like protein